MATKQKKEKKPLTSITLSQKTAKANEQGKFYRLRDGAYVKLSGAPEFWKTNPDLIYLGGYYWVGDYPEIYYALQLHGFDNNAIQTELAKSAITGRNYQADKAQLFDLIVKDHERVKSKNAAQKRADDEAAYMRLAEYRALKKQLGSAKAVGVVVDSRGATVGTGAGRGARQYTTTLQQRVDEARSKGKVVNVNAIVQSGAIDTQGRLRKVSEFGLKTVSGKERDYRHIPELAITASDPNALMRAADILGASQQVKDSIRGRLGVGPIYSPAVQQLVGAVPPQFAPSTTVGPAFAQQPLPTQQPVSTISQMRQAPPASFMQSGQFQQFQPTQFPTQFQQPAQFPTQFQQFQPVSAPQPVSVLPRQSPPRQFVSPVAPPTMVAAQSSPRAASPILPPARTSPVRVPSPGSSRLVGGIPAPTVVGAGLPSPGSLRSSPRAASPLSSSPRSSVAPVRLSPRTSPLRTAPTQTLGPLSSPGRLPMPSQLQ